MKKVFFVMMMLLSNTFGGHDHEKSIHFKIHLPEFIKHHIHTKTVFIHVHDMKPEEKENHKTDNHFEDWTSYSYNYNNGFKDSHLKSYHRKNLAIPYLNSIPIREHDYQIPNTPYYSSSNFPDTNNLQISNETSISIFKPFIGSTHIVDNQPSTDDNIRDISSQYKIYEDVDEEIPKNNNNNQQFYKQGYRYGIKTEMGHVIRKNMKDFIDNENEQESYRNDLYEDENSKSYNTLNNHGKYDKEIEQENKEATERIDKRLLVAKLVI